MYKIVHAMGVTSWKKAELTSYQLKDIAQVWHTQWKGNMPVESGTIEWEEFKATFLGKYYPRERREFKVEEVMKLNQGNMRIEEHSLKFSMLSKYAPSLVSNSRDDMSRFMMGVADLVREECHTTMQHDDMTLSRLMMYAQSIEVSKLKRMSRNLKRSGYSD